MGGRRRAPGWSLRARGARICTENLFSAFSCDQTWALLSQENRHNGGAACAFVLRSQSVAMHRAERLAAHVAAPAAQRNHAASEGSVAPHPGDVGGHVARGFEAVESAFVNNFDAGLELGAQLCVYHKGRVVVDLWGKATAQQYAEPMQNQAGREVSETLSGYGADSLQCVYSSTKNLMALCIAMCIDRGLLSYSDRIAQHWPAFAQGGKADLTVADVLRHEAGLVRFHRLATAEEAADWEAMATLIEESPVLWFVSKYTPPPNPELETGRRGYHAVSRGLILNCLLMRIDPQRRTMGEFLAQEITGPLSVDVFCGMPRELQEAHHIADMAPFQMRWSARDPDHKRTLAELDIMRIAVEGSCESTTLLSQCWLSPAPPAPCLFACLPACLLSTSVTPYGALLLPAFPTYCS